MLLQELFFDTKRGTFEINSTKIEAGEVIISVSCTQRRNKCPDCNKCSTRLHGYYFRKVKDLPMLGHSVLINLRVGKYYCQNNRCSRKVFTERFTDHFLPYKRTTTRLSEKLLKIALLMGGNPGKKLCDTLNINTSSSSLILQIHQKEIQVSRNSTHIGIDDWAYKKGHTYGTAIIDLEDRRVIDLLPDRATNTVETWLRKRCGIKVVTRDRYTNYAKGVTNGAPNACQVADRWHLLKNMGDAIRKFLERKRQQLRREEIACAEKAGKEQVGTGESQLSTEHCSKDRRFSKLNEIKQLYANGTPIRAIAGIVNMSRNTVKKYIHLDEPPSKNGPGSEILKFADYFKERIKACPGIEVIQLWKEITKRGYAGSRSVVYEFLKNYSRFKNKVNKPYVPRQSWSAAKVSLLLYKADKKLSDSEQSLLHALKEKSPDINIAFSLVQTLKAIMLNKQGHKLKKWIAKAMKCPIHELKAFAKGLLTDFSAVKNAFSLQWSNGQVEGQINKLKTVKRQMYGRANFNLLRKRIILG
jgi:transposase